MGQLGFFDADKRLEALSAKGDPLEAIDRLVPWESFRAEVEAVVLTSDELKKSSAGRKPFDALLMFRMLVLQALNNLSDEQVEYQVRDRLSFSRFLGLAIEDSIPDSTTLWLFREKLAKGGLIEKLFDCFDQHLAAKGYMARGGQIIDASIVPVPTQRNSRDENAELQAGRTPAAWKQKPAKVRQKDRDARWTKKHGRSFFGYKNHVNADAKHKLIRHYAVTDAAVHDSQELDGLLDTGNTCNDVFADSAYRSTKIEGRLRASGFKSRIHRRATRNHPLSNAQLKANRNRSKIRARIEHVFGAQEFLAGRPDRAHDRHRAGTRQDWLAEPGLQHSPPCDAGAHRHRMKVKSARSIKKGASSGQTAASLVENHARKPPSSPLIANYASKPALFEVPLGIRKLVPVLLSHCAQGNGSYADKRPNGRESCTRHKRVPSPADAGAHAGRLCRVLFSFFLNPPLPWRVWRATICVSRCAHTNALIGRMVDYGLPSRPTRTACG